MIGMNINAKNVNQAVLSAICHQLNVLNVNQGNIYQILDVGNVHHLVQNAQVIHFALLVLQD